MDLSLHKITWSQLLTLFISPIQEDSSHSLEASGITQVQVLSSISQTCQVDPLNIPQALSSIAGQISHEPTLLPNSNPVESREDGVNQAWFTTKEDKDSLQGKGEVHR